MIVTKTCGTCQKPTDHREAKHCLRMDPRRPDGVTYICKTCGKRTSHDYLAPGYGEDWR